MGSKKSAGDNLEVIALKREHKKTLTLLAALYLTVEESVFHASGEHIVPPEGSLMKDIQKHLDRHHGR